MPGACRDLLEVLTTPGYVSMVTGEPGVGKTTLSLMACIAHGGCTYISYADPEQVLRGKLAEISPEFKGPFRVTPELSGRPEDAFTAIAEATERGELVVVDTVDAMLFGTEAGLRPLVQLIYGTVKAKPGSLVLVSEGNSQAFMQLRFVADALVRIDLDDVLGQPIRAVRLLKDRDRPVEHPKHYATFSNMSVLEPFSLLERPKLGPLRSVKLPPYGQIKAQLESGPNILTELDSSVSNLRARLIFEFLAANYLINGYPVNYVVGPNERENDVKEDIEELAGERVKDLRVIRFDARSVGFSSERTIEQLLKAGREDAVSVVNLLAEEDFAVNSPLEYENFVYLMTRYKTERKMISLLYGYSNLKATEIQGKYANVLRRYTVVDGFTFWRSIRPLGPVYFTRLDPERGEIEYVEMK